MAFKPNPIAADRKFVIDQWLYLFERLPSAAEVDREVARLQRGVETQKQWMARMEKWDIPAAVDRIFRLVLGRPPTAAEQAGWRNKFQQGLVTRKTAKELLAGSTEGQLYARTQRDNTALEGQKDAHAQLQETLAEFGLSELSDWAWEQIKSGNDETQIMQDLRKQEPYKIRFAGNEQRRANGIPPMSEYAYIQYEAQAKALMRQNGLPPGFWDDPADFHALIAADVSPAELNTRIQDGYVRAMQAPAEVRAQFAQWYGPDGASALAAFMLDPAKATPVLERMLAAAEVGGVGDQFGFDLGQARAEELASIGVEGQEARQGFGELRSIDSLFSESVSETQDLTVEGEGVDAVFDLGGDGGNVLQRRQRERAASLAGGGGAAVQQSGLGLGAAQ